MRRLVIAIAFLLATSSHSQANILINGSFEQGTPTGSFTTLPLGSTAITGWTVTNENIDIVGTFWVSQHGARGVDLDGLQPGCLAQTVATTPGQVYVLTFYRAGNPACGSPLKQMSVTAAGQSANYTFDTTGRTRTSMGWLLTTWSFTANAATTTLEFCSSANTLGCGPAIDNVVLDLTTPSRATTWGRLKTIYR